MSSLFISILRQAFKTFDRANQQAFSANFAQLRQLTEKLTSCDIHISPQKLLNDAAIDEYDNKAPCTFVHIFENDIVSMSVFVMRSGYTMPLHDHPMMHGLLRGIFGNLRVQSYTQQLDATEPLVYNRATREMCVRVEEPRLFGPDTECAILTPRERNFHEITAVDGTAAFFDILAPPYDVLIPEYGRRHCNFYRKKKSSTSAISFYHPSECLILERIPAPVSYYCNTVETPEAVRQCTCIYASEMYSA